MDRPNAAPDAILIGGPRDGVVFTAEDAAVIELELDGLIQRYLRTTNRQDDHGRSLVIFAYDGAASPKGAEPHLKSP